MIESKGNMYKWTTHQWNPVGGDCCHKCSYCYVNRWGAKPPLNLKEHVLKEDLGSGKTIFVVSGGDLFAKDVPDEWIYRVLEHCRKFDNEYLFQSKNPLRFSKFLEFFPKSIFCTTIETNRSYVEMGDTPVPFDRALGLWQLDGSKRFLTIEPIMDFDVKEMVELVKLTHATQVNIGADSGHNNLTEPSKEKVLDLIRELSEFTTIDRKTNLERLLR